MFKTVESINKTKKNKDPLFFLSPIQTMDIIFKCEKGYALIIFLFKNLLNML